jgi:hypothetical protein
LPLKLASLTRAIFLDFSKPIQTLPPINIEKKKQRIDIA